MSVTRSLTQLSRCMSSMVAANVAAAPFRRNFITSATGYAAVVTSGPRGLHRRIVACGPSVPLRHYQATGKRDVNGDKQLLEFLNEEIKEEAKAHPGNLPAIEGFDANCDEAMITLTKKFGNEIITVKFNVNNSIQMDEEAYEEDPAKQEQQPATTVSVPSFTVEINRGGKSKLAFRCTFPDDDVGDEASTTGEEEAAEDPFEIEELALYEKEWNEKTFTVQASFMDGTLYDLLVQALQDRGINQKFTDQLVAFSTNYEHGSYIRFLENLREFVKAK